MCGSATDGAAAFDELAISCRKLRNLEICRVNCVLRCHTHFGFTESLRGVVLDRLRAVALWATRAVAGDILPTLLRPTRADAGRAAAADVTATGTRSRHVDGR